MSMRYHAPRDLPALLALLEQFRGSATIVAGGTEVVTRLRQPGPGDEDLIDIVQVRELGGIAETDSGRLQLGALTTCAELLASSAVARRAPILAQAASSVGGPQIRNVATIGGNICIRCPRADLVPALLALDAVVMLQRHDGARRLPLSEYLDEPPRRDELLTMVDCDGAPDGTAFLRLAARRSVSPATASVAVRLGEGESIRIALGGVAPTAMRARKAEKTFSACSGMGFAQAAKLAAEAARREAAPASDAWASAEYRRHVVGVLLRRALMAASKHELAA